MRQSLGFGEKEESSLLNLPQDRGRSDSPSTQTPVKEAPGRWVGSNSGYSRLSFCRGAGSSMGLGAKEGTRTGVAWNPDLHQLESHLSALWMAKESGERLRTKGQ